MNTLDDLRAQLDHDAAAVTDAGAADRHDQVHGRIRTLRRRRRAGAAGGVVAAVAAAGLVVPLMTTGPTPEPPVAAMPESVAIYDFDYELRDVHAAEAGERSLEVDLGDDTEDLAVAVETENLPDGTRIRLTTETGSVLAVGIAGGAPLAPYPLSGTEQGVAVEVDARTPDSVVELGVYERTDELPSGLSDGNAVFRDRVGADELVTGAFLEPGEAEGTFEFTGRLSDVEFAKYCDGPKGVGITIEVDGGFVSGGDCRDESYVDAHSGGLFGVEGERVRTHTVRFFTSDEAAGDEVVPVDGVELGVAVYREGEQRTVDGQELDEVLEAQGRDWRIAAVRGPRTQVSVPADGDPVLVGFVAGPGERVVFLSTNGKRGVGLGSGGWTLDSMIWPDRDARLELVDATDRPVDGRIVLYRPTD